jgi:hypothetical protein
MSWTHPLRRACCAALLLAAVWHMAPTAGAQLMKRLSFDERVQKSDVIATATCTGRTSTFVNGKLVTTYRLKPDEFWKGAAKLNKSGELEVQELGGSLNGPIPITTTVPGYSSGIGVGDDLLLFMSHPKVTDGAGSKSVDTSRLRIVGGLQGNFAVLRNPETGEKLVSQNAAKGLEAKVQAEAQRRAEQKIEQMHARGLAAADTKETTQTQLARLQAEEAAPMQRSLSKRLDSQAKRARSQRDADAKRDPARAEDIYNFEPLASVKERVQESIKSGG